MALWRCDGTYDGKPCGTDYAVGLLRCPRCQSTEFHELGSRPEDEGDPMAKITKHGGPSDATVPAEDQPAAEPVIVDSSAVAEPVDAAVDDGDNGPERPGSKAVRADWVAWAGGLGYTTNALDSLTVAQITALPDYPAFAEDGTIDVEGTSVAVDAAEDDYGPAIEAYNAAVTALAEDAASEGDEGEGEAPPDSE
jgi:hypothetical protein